MAEAFDLGTPVVEAYSDLYFNVLDRRESPAYLRAAFESGVTGEHETKPPRFPRGRQGQPVCVGRQPRVSGAFEWDMTTLAIAAIGGAAGFRGVAVSVQRQLERFERSGVLVREPQGRTLVFSWNPKSRLAGRLQDLVAVVHEGMSVEAKAILFK